MTITLYGIANCDTVKKARTWLAAEGFAFAFHDFKRDGLSPALLGEWLRSVEWERLLNRKGTTWRRLDDAARASVTDAGSACALMLAQPSLVKRPVVRWADASISVGFDPAHFAQMSRRR
ncbi:MAG TPA: ArsC family reductase [Burkholderiaceae bacterium]|jgi:Spx/MgsR family transcriptional regulator|nr:ArsC family reductase [Burkholderiaceae bacterium]